MIFSANSMNLVSSAIQDINHLLERIHHHNSRICKVQIEFIMDCLQEGLMLATSRFDDGEPDENQQ